MINRETINQDYYPRRAFPRGWPGRDFFIAKNGKKSIKLKRVTPSKKATTCKRAITEKKTKLRKRATYLKKTRLLKRVNHAK